MSDIRKLLEDFESDLQFGPGHSSSEYRRYQQAYDENKAKLLEYVEGMEDKLKLAKEQNYCSMCGNILDGYEPPKQEGEG